MKLDALDHPKTFDFAAREILSGWARRKAHAFRVASRRFAANGVQPELTGLEPEDTGVPAKGGRR